MSEIEEDLRTTSDAVVADAGRLTDLEAKKRHLEPEDPERVELAEEIAATGDRLGKSTAAEAELARVAEAEAQRSPGSPERPIADSATDS
jgi:hypothetical protein